MHSPSTDEPETNGPGAERTSLRETGPVDVGEQRFRALADATPQIVWTLDLEGGVIYLNHQGREYFGLEQDWEAFSWGPMIDGDDIQVVRDVWKVAQETGTMFEAEFRLKRHDGEYRWHLGRALPVYEDGEITHWCGTSTDIHDLKAAHQVLEERERLFRTMADTAPVLIWRSDESKEFTYVNQGWLNFRGRSAEDEIGFGWTEGLHPEDYDRYLRTYSEAFERRVPFRMEFRLRRHDGQYRWILDHGAPAHSADGAFSGYIGSCIDIDERRRLEDQVRFLAEASPILTSSLEYETTLQSVARLIVPKLADWCAIDMVMPSGQTELLAVTHVDPDKVDLGRELRRRYPTDMSASTGVPQVIRTGESELYPEITDEMLRATARDEEFLDIVRSIGFRSALIVPLKARGHTLGAMTLVWSESDRLYSESDLRFAEELARRAAIVVDNARLYRQAKEARDEFEKLNQSLEVHVALRTEELRTANESLREEIEERRRAQQALARANSLLEQRNRELQDFAHVASHDLQEPLRKIVSFSSLLDEEFGEGLQDGRRYVTRIQDSAERMTILIQDLLEFSRIATRGEAFRKLGLGRIVEEVLGDLELRITETGGRVDIGEMCAVEADPVQMRQLFQNLIGNALKFHREGVPPIVQIRTQINGSGCTVEVEDNGIGFDEVFLERIFSPFQRLHGRGSFPGTGMGLAICRRIAERHGGSITARSREDHGSTFVVLLPLRQPSH